MENIIFLFENPGFLRIAAGNACLEKNAELDTPWNEILGHLPKYDIFFSKNCYIVNIFVGRNDSFNFIKGR